MPKPTNKARIKTSKRMKIIYFALFYFREEKKIEKREKSSQSKCTKYRCPHNQVHVSTPALT